MSTHSDHQWTAEIGHTFKYNALRDKWTLFIKYPADLSLLDRDYSRDDVAEIQCNPLRFIQHKGLTTALLTINQSEQTVYLTPSQMRMLKIDVPHTKHFQRHNLNFTSNDQNLLDVDGQINQIYRFGKASCP